MKKDVALVLSSGGARGFAHIGVINALEKQGYNITSVAGTSMGALVGGIYATGELHDLQEWLCSLDMMEVLKLTDFTISKSGLVKGKRVIDKMKELVPERDIESLFIPFCAVATDIINGTEKTFTEGNLYDAIRASISIPNVFTPFRIGDNYYVDGGVVNPIPANRVHRKDGDFLFVVDVNAQIPHYRNEQETVEVTDKKFLKKLRLFNKKHDKTIPVDPMDKIGMFNLTNRSLSLMVNRISTLTMERCDADLLINISKESFGTYDFYKAKDIIAEGERATEEALKQIAYTNC